MKQCSSCREWKDEGEFNWRYKALGIRQPSCRECQHGHQAKYYQEHKDYEKARTHKRRTRVREEAREFVYQYKLTYPCQICGETDPDVLEFDHIRGKGSTINRLVNEGVSIERLKIEISLCQVLCANCHRRKTLSESKRG